MTYIGMDRNLFYSPLYQSEKNGWGVFDDQIRQCADSLTLDISAIASIISFNYTTGNRTLFHEIKRQPWLSGIDEQGGVHHESIPAHGVNWDSSENIAKRLFELLVQEAEEVCRTRNEIYLLLSGGLDSRIVAGVVGHLYRQGKIPRPIGVTWGLKNCRDVQYARAMAKILDFNWQHVPIAPGTLLENIHEGFPLIGGLVSPTHLHAMLWFKNVSQNALVLAGSYGDSIGRAEFSGRHLLELDVLRPSNPFGLLKNEVLPQARQGVLDDADQLRQRAAKHTADYAICEHQMQGFYMRNMIAHVMSVIEHYCTLYQMFTAPQVYKYMWSLHPARRDDRIYAALLGNHLPELARLPWARTNRALSGKTIGADATLQKEFHHYADWCSGPLYPQIRSLVEPDWFESTGVFNREAVNVLNESLAPGQSDLKYLGNKPYDIWLWLAGFRVFYEKTADIGKEITIDSGSFVASESTGLPQDSRSKLRRMLAGNPTLHKIVSKMRRQINKRAAIRKFPPNYIK